MQGFTQPSHPVYLLIRHVPYAAWLLNKVYEFEKFSNIVFWCFDGEVIPLPIPNREVTLASTNDSLNGKSR